MKTFSPSSRRPWDERLAAHLLNRAGFGGPPEEVRRLTRLGHKRAVDALLDYEKIPDPIPLPEWAVNPPEDFAFPDKMAVKYAALAGAKERYDRGQELQRQRGKIGQELKVWWMRRICESPRPFEEKMVLFWHGHFTSSLNDGLNSYWMYLQNALFRRQAVGNFKQLTIDVTKDPAMLRYLDNDRNRKARPNENYARELMELFTMGIGNYTEDDIKQSARAFSGWTRRDSEFVFRAFDHDYGVKTFLGRTGNFDASDVIDIIFEQPVTAKFIAKKLWTFFAYENPEPSLVDALAGVFRKSNYELRPLMRAIFTSDAFYSEQALRAHVKSPVELASGIIRTLKIENPRYDSVLSMCRQMGQDLLSPPNVKGWDGGKLWVNTTTLFIRYNLARMLVNDGGLVTPAPTAKDQSPKPRSGPIDLDRVFDRAKLQSPEVVVDQLVWTLLHDRLPKEQRAELVAFLTAGLKDAKFDPTTPEAENKMRSLAYILMSSPAYQLS